MMEDRVRFEPVPEDMDECTFKPEIVINHWILYIIIIKRDIPKIIP